MSVSSCSAEETVSAGTGEDNPIPGCDGEGDRSTAGTFNCRANSLAESSPLGREPLFDPEMERRGLDGFDSEQAMGGDLFIGEERGVASSLPGVRRFRLATLFLGVAVAFLLGYCHLLLDCLRRVRK